MSEERLSSLTLFSKKQSNGGNDDVMDWSDYCHIGIRRRY